MLKKKKCRRRKKEKRKEESRKGKEKKKERECLEKWCVLRQWGRVWIKKIIKKSEKVLF